MRIALHDSDKNKFPNLALMKLSYYHKAIGDDVSWWNPMEQYDRVYSSKVFTFTPEEPLLPENTVKGGTGYGIYTELPPEIDARFPDYNIYPGVDYAIGFLTRGCIRNCPWCVVPQKEGMIKPYRKWREIIRYDSRDIVFMDNNVLACDYGIEQMADMIGHNVRIDFNQGLDARLITPLGKVALLTRFGIKPYRIFVYLLVQDVKSAEFRALRLRDAGVDVFAQPYRDFENKIEPTQEMKDFARWVNRKPIFKSTRDFSEYRRHKQ